MGRVRLAGAVLALLAALPAGCATSTQDPAPAAVESTPAAPSPPPSPSPSGIPMGQAGQANNGQVEATVFGYRQPLSADGPSGAVWGGADVQICVQRSAIFDVTVSRGPWRLLAADGSTVAATLSADGQFPQPAYPTDHRRLHPGDCVRGWLAFAVPANAHPAAVQYAPTGAAPVTWAVR